MRVSRVLRNVAEAQGAVFFCAEKTLGFAKKAAPETGKIMVPGVGFEPTHLSISVFETDASAVPPSGRRLAV